MREKAIDTFQTLFERAAIPVLHIQEVRLARISAVIKGGPLDQTVLDLCDYFRRRFEGEIRLHYPASASVEASVDAARERGITAQGEPFHSTAELIGHVSLAQSQMVVIPEPADEAARVVDKDDLVRGTAPPILLVRKPLGDAAAPFRRILHSLSGDFQQTRNFSYSFGLAEDEGRILLLHAIDAAEIDAVRRTLKVTLDVEKRGEAEILEELRHHGERYLKAVVAAARKSPYEVQYRLVVGDVVGTVQAELSRGGWGLLVVGRHEQGYSRISAADYELMHLVRDVPVLAL